jgi:hypothetical protein
MKTLPLFLRRLLWICFTGFFISVSAQFDQYCLAQTPDWSWAKGMGGSGMDISNGIARDSYGNLYIAGYFQGDTLTLGAFTLLNPEGYPSTEIFIAKLDSLGNVLWAKNARGTSYDECFGIAVDPSGDIYITGWFASPTLSFSDSTLTNAGGHDVFVAKYDPSGNVLWAKQGAGSAYEEGQCLATDPAGNIYVMGRFQGTTTFGDTTLTAEGVWDVFLVKYSPSGDVVWAKREGGNGDDAGYGISTDLAGNIYATGSFYSDSIRFGNTTLKNSGHMGSTDFFVVKYYASGEVSWARNADCYESDAGYGVTSDTRGNVYVVGQFNYSAMRFGDQYLSIGTGNNVFIVKYDSSGTALWARGTGGDQFQNLAREVRTDAADGVYIAGWFRSPTISFGATTLQSAGYSDLFVAKYNASGDALWAKSAGGASADEIDGMTIDSGGNLYLTGIYGSQIGFEEDTLVYSGVYDIFVAKLAGLLTGIPEASSPLAPTSFSLQQNYPNPFNPKTVISYQLPVVSNVRLGVYDLLGREVALLVNEKQPAGSYSVTFDGGKLASGTYLYRIVAERYVHTKRMVLVR